MGIRETKKAETKKKLLECAEQLFQAKGYQGVTTAEIAREAGIAEGTLFNYFRNKGELFIAVMMPSNASDEHWHITMTEMSARKLAEAVLPALTYELSKFEHAEKRALRDYFAVVYGGGAESKGAQAGLLAEDERILQALRAFLQLQQKAFPRQMEGFDVEKAVACAYGCIVALISQYVLMDSFTFENLKARLREQLAFIWTGHIVSA